MVSRDYDEALKLNWKEVTKVVAGTCRSLSECLEVPSRHYSHTGKQLDTL